MLSSKHWPTFFQMASGPYSRTASAFWISTVLLQRRQATRNRCLEIWFSRSRRPDAAGSGLPPSAPASTRSACQYSGGKVSFGPSAGDPGAFLTTARAIASIWNRVGMRQRAGWSVMAVIRTYHEQKSRDGRIVENWDFSSRTLAK
ncbi:hypothetical protein IP86_17570 [Rhodopseudomonas sp. AAP120]|nr:hypothetical protein IP86_17570 [Rhodopseudomonas sp. AAP120]